MQELNQRRKEVEEVAGTCADHSLRTRDFPRLFPALSVSRSSKPRNLESRAGVLLDAIFISDARSFELAFCRRVPKCKPRPVRKRLKWNERKDRALLWIS
jgi:hypothetical protein